MNAKYCKTNVIEVQMTKKHYFFWVEWVKVIDIKGTNKYIKNTNKLSKGFGKDQMGIQITRNNQYLF